MVCHLLDRFCFLFPSIIPTTKTALHCSASLCPFSTCWRSGTIVTPGCFKLFWGNWLIQCVGFLFQKTGGILSQMLIAFYRKKARTERSELLQDDVLLPGPVELLIWRSETLIVLWTVWPLWMEQWKVVAMSGLQDDFFWWETTVQWRTAVKSYLSLLRGA